jgi:hypothetical protein
VNMMGFKRRDGKFVFVSCQYTKRLNESTLARVGEVINLNKIT